MGNELVPRGLDQPAIQLVWTPITSSLSNRRFCSRQAFPRWSDPPNEQRACRKSFLWTSSWYTEVLNCLRYSQSHTDYHRAKMGNRNDIIDLRVALVGTSLLQSGSSCHVLEFDYCVLPFICLEKRWGGTRCYIYEFPVMLDAVLGTAGNVVMSNTWTLLHKDF